MKLQLAHRVSTTMRLLHARLVSTTTKHRLAHHVAAVGLQHVAGAGDEHELRGRDLLPAVLPPLLKRPMHMAHITALGVLSGAASRDIHTFAHKIVPAVAAELAVLGNKSYRMPDGRELTRENLTAIIAGKISR